MRKLLILTCWLVIAASLMSCGGKGSASKTSGIAYRAFVSNPIGNVGLFVVNAATDLHPGNLAPISAGSYPTLMMVTPDRAQTLVFSPGANPLFPDDEFTIITNASESAAGHVVLPGTTENFVISPDSSTAYVAVPEAPVTNQSPGAIEMVSVAGAGQGTFTGEIYIPSVQYLSINNGGDRILAFSPNSNSVAVVTPANVGTSFPVVSYVAGFDRPVQAFFSSDDSTAYVVNCGAECGGSTGGVQTLNMTNNVPGAAVSACVLDEHGVQQCAATEALVNGSTMYVAGTPYSNGVPSLDCNGQQTSAANCGMVTIFDLGSMSLINTSPIRISDGYHSRIAMGGNGQLFIGSTTCTEISSSTETRGCLSIYNTQTAANGNVAAGAVIIPPVNGDVTGIQPIETRNVVYLVQGYANPGGSLYIYCTSIDNSGDCYNADALQTAPENVPTYAPLMNGNFYDVVTVDF